MKKVVSIFMCLIFLNFYSQESVLTGLILNDQNLPITNVNIQFNKKGSTSDNNGYYRIEVESNKKIDVVFSHINYKELKITVDLTDNEILEFNPILNTKFEQISEVILNTTTRSELKSIQNISPEKLRYIKGVQPGIENILKTLPGVSINNEMSTQYSVRGGNFDENLVYVNGIEIYRPFLIRSGQQEGLSFINSEMIDDIKFSSGGFEAIYGDKMSSVLDIKYKSPNSNQYKLNSSFLGGSFTSENISKNKNISNILGLRYRDNSLLVNSKETNSNFKPSFLDIQNFFKINLNSKVSVSSIINFSLNKYNFQPINRQTNFGTLDDPLALIIFYDGEEKDKYSTYFNSVAIDFKPNQRDIYTLSSSFYNTNEKEYFDILAQYNLAEVNTNIGSENLGEYTGEWLEIEFPDPLFITSFTLSGASSENLPRSFKIIGSNDRTNYDILGEYTDVTVATDEGTNFKIDSGNYYDHYAIIITRIHKISSTNNVAIRWLRYFTAPVVLNDKTWWHRENNQMAEGEAEYYASSLMATGVNSYNDDYMSWDGQADWNQRMSENNAMMNEERFFRDGTVMVGKQLLHLPLTYGARNSEWSDKLGCLGWRRNPVGEIVYDYFVNHDVGQNFVQARQRIGHWINVYNSATYEQGFETSFQKSWQQFVCDFEIYHGINRQTDTCANIEVEPDVSNVTCDLGGDSGGDSGRLLSVIVTLVIVGVVALCLIAWLCIASWRRTWPFSQ